MKPRPIITMRMENAGGHTVSAYLVKSDREGYTWRDADQNILANSRNVMGSIQPLMEWANNHGFFPISD